MVTNLTIIGTQRIERRGDPTNAVRNGTYSQRTWTYGATLGPNGTFKNYLLKTYTDFQGNSTTLNYDVNGRVSSIVDAHPGGHTTSFIRLAATGAITKVTHPGDLSHLDYTYDSSGYYLLTAKDERGKTTTYTRDSLKNITQIDYPDGGIEKFEYNGFNQVTKHFMPSPTAAQGAATDSEKYSYDGFGRLLTYTPPSTASDPAPSPHPTGYAYNSNDHVSTVTDPKGNVTTLSHNEIGQTTIVQHPGDHQITDGYVYNVDGTLDYKSIQLTATTWAETHYIYDDYKRLRTVTDPLQHVTNYWYSTIGAASGDLTHTDSNVTRLVLPSGMVTQTLYDENLRQGSTTVGYGSGEGAKTSYTYDEVGNRKTTIDPKGATWTYNYDARERLINVVDPLVADRNNNNHTIDYTYDAANNKLTEQRANNQVISYDSYDNRNRLLQMTVQQAPTADAVTTYTWSNSGNMLSMVDPKLHTYSYDYDRLNRLVTLTYPVFNSGHPTESYLYDIAGNLYQFTNRNGDVQTFTYDSRNREKTYSWSSGLPQARTLIYDDASRVTSCNTSSTKINFVYNADDTFKSQEEWTTYFGDSDGTTNHRTLTYTYNVDANRDSVVLTGTGKLGYEYTSRNQLSAVTNGVGGTSYVDYIYDKNGNMTSRTLQSSPSSTFIYDAVNRVTSITHNFVGKSRAFSYAYDAVGNRQFEQRDNNLGRDDFVYDLGSQMTTFARTSTLGGSTNTNAVFTFDASGNRSKLIKDSVTTNYTINNLNGYATVTGVANPSYDNSGNLLSYDGGTFTYDSMNRLTQAVKNGITEKFYYDGLNRQIARSSTGSSTLVTVWDGWNVYAEFTPGSSAPSERLIYGAGGDLAKSLTNSRNYYPDALGSTSFVATAVGGLLECYTYDHYGTPVVYDASGNQRTGGTIYGITRLFTGQQWHPATGLYDNRNRFLLPSLGRFLQADPIGFDGDPANLYRYVANNPVNLSDPTGLNVEWIGLFPPHVATGVNDPSSGTGWRYYDFVPGSINVLTGPGEWRYLGTDRPPGTSMATLQTTSDQDASIVGAFRDKVANQGDRYNPVGNNCFQAPARVVMDVIGGPVYSVLRSIGKFFANLFGQNNSSANPGTTNAASNPAAATLGAVLSKASYRDSSGLVYDANGNVIGDARSLFQSDSTNVNIFQFPSGAMSLPDPGQNAVLKIIQQ